jgi:hypothetical protein
VVFTVRFRDFWPGFDPSNFFLPLIRRAIGPSVELKTNGVVDLEIVSVFPPQSLPGKLLKRITNRPSRTPLPSHRARKSIWYTGENIRPPLGDWDQYWGFDPTSSLAKTKYLPLWWTLFPELVEAPIAGNIEALRLGRELTLSEVTNQRSTDMANRRKFACMFTSHPEPSRVRVAAALSRLGQVDIFGAWTKQIVPDKISVGHEYQFVICLENDFYPGYVTEKIFDAWAVGAIPIWGGIDPGDYLNRNAYLNLVDLGSIDALVSKVKDLMSDNRELGAMSQQPILAKVPNLEDIKDNLRALLL